MGKVLVTDTYLTDIANAIREKTGETTTFKPGEMAAAISNISGGEPSEPKDILNEFYDAYCKFYDSLTPEYNKTYDTNDNVILYSPAANYTNYFIIYRSDGYTICWFAGTFNVGYFNYSSYRYVFRPIATWYISQTSLFANGTKQNKVSSASSMISINTSNSGMNFYYSETYATVDECIEAMKNGTATYTLTTSTSFAANYYNNTKTCVVATNSIEIGDDNAINECGRQLSSNETIVVAASS